MAASPPPGIFSPPHFNNGRGGGVQATAAEGAASGRIGGTCRRTRWQNRAPAGRRDVCVNRSLTGGGGVYGIKLRPSEAAAEKGAAGGIQLRMTGWCLRGSPVTT
jgi:hypothetical protein